MVAEGRNDDGADEPETRAESNENGHAARAVAPLFSCHARVMVCP
ncbi:hypothetical protein BAN20980_03040 [Burkholderia anthina]|uniref:Uncharacterized protein n=1 Tax=Burkholderia anthina TaxID=179879 RepID=A0A6P2GBG9_9BURK|nr:hypothetical protein BAN20980_03040 [Burkholderia anthina]